MQPGLSSTLDMLLQLLHWMQQQPRRQLRPMHLHLHPQQQQQQEQLCQACVAAARLLLQVTACSF
jgi:hypothetical protein